MSTSPNINPALKPPKPRLPLKDITVVPQDEDTTVPRRRVSFANVNKIKEFSAVAESMVVCRTPAYEEPFYMSSDSSYPSGIDACTPGKSGNLPETEKLQASFQSENNYASTTMTDENRPVGMTPVDESRNCSKFSSDMELTEVAGKASTINMHPEMLIDVTKCRNTSPTIFFSEALEMTEAINDPRISLCPSRVGEFTGNILSSNNTRYSEEGMDLTKPLSSNITRYSVEGMDLTKPVYSRKSYSRRQSTRYSMSAMELTEMIDSPALSVLDQEEDIEKRRSSTRYSIKDMETTEVVHVDYTRCSTNSMECTEVIDGKLDYSADSETSMDFTKPVNNICLSTPIHGDGSSSVSTCSSVLSKVVHDHKDTTDNQGLILNGGKRSSNILLKSPPSIDLKVIAECSLDHKASDENDGETSMPVPEKVSSMQNIGNQSSLIIDQSKSPTDCPDYVLPSYDNEKKLKLVTSTTTNDPEPHISSNDKDSKVNTSLVTIDRSHRKNLSVFDNSTESLCTSEGFLQKDQIINNSISSKAFDLQSKDLFPSSGNITSRVIQTPLITSLEMTGITSDIDKGDESGSKQSADKHFISEINSSRDDNKKSKSFPSLVNQEEFVTENMEISILVETPLNDNTSKQVVINLGKESELSQNVGPGNLQNENNKYVSSQSISDHMGGESFSKTADLENDGDKFNISKSKMNCITTEASSNSRHDSPTYINISNKISNITLTRGCSNKSIIQHNLTANNMSYSSTVENTDQLEELPLLQRLALKERVKNSKSAKTKVNGGKRSFEEALEQENDTEESPVKQICLSADSTTLNDKTPSFMMDNLSLNETKNSNVHEKKLCVNQAASPNDKRSHCTVKLTTPKTGSNDVSIRLDSHGEVDLSINDNFSLHVSHDFSTHPVNSKEATPKKDVSTVVSVTTMAEGDVNFQAKSLSSLISNEEEIAGTIKPRSLYSLISKSGTKEIEVSKSKTGFPSRSENDNVFSLHTKDYSCCMNKGKIFELRKGVVSLNLIPKWIELQYSEKSDGSVSHISHKVLSSGRNKEIGEYLLRRVQLLTLPHNGADLVNHTSGPMLKFLSNIAKQLDLICNYHCGLLKEDILIIELVRCDKKIWACIDINIKYPQYLNASDITISKQILGNLRITQIRSIFNDIEKSPHQLLDFVKALKTNI